MEAQKILGWKNSKGVKKALVLVEDTSVPKEDVMRKRLEVSIFDDNHSEWKKDEIIDSVDKIDSYGVPKEVVD